VKENDTKELSNSMFLNVVTIFFTDFPKIIELLVFFSI